MKIGIAGPVATESISHLLNEHPDTLPKGMAGAPFLTTLVEYLIQNGHQVSVYTLDWELTAGEKELVVVKGDKLTVYYGGYRPRSFRFTAKKVGRMVDFFRLERRALGKAIEIDQPEIVHAHWSYEYALAALATEVPSLVTCHDSPVRVLRFMPNLYRFGRLIMAVITLRKAKNLTAVSPYLKQSLEKISKRKIAVIPNPAPSNLFPEKLPLVSKERFEKPVVMMVNNGWGKLKNVKAGIEAFQMLRRNFPEATLHLYGADYQPGGAAEQWAKKKELEKGLEFYGPTTHGSILKALSRSTLFLHTAREECCPMALVEAMVFGAPVIGGKKSGGVPWVLGSGSAGILANIELPEEIAFKMQELLQNRSLYHQIRQSAFEYAVETFMPGNVIKKYLSYYGQIIKT